MTKTAVAKNLNKTLSKPKPKPLSAIEKAVAKMHEEIRKVPKAFPLDVPDALYLEKSSTKAQLAAQVVELMKALNSANISLERISIANVRSIHNEKMALKRLADEKKRVKA